MNRLGLFDDGMPRALVIGLLGMGLLGLCGCVSTSRPISNIQYDDSVETNQTSIVDLKINRYTELSEEFPKEPKYHERLARLYWSRKEHRPALTHLSSARELDPENPRYDFIAGRIHTGIGNFTGAEAAYKSMISKTPRGYPGPTYELGFLYLALGREADAQKMFGKALEIDPSFPDPHYQLGGIHARLDKKRAIYHYEEYLRLGGRIFHKDTLRELNRLQPELRRYNP